MVAIPEHATRIDGSPDQRSWEENAAASLAKATANSGDVLWDDKQGVVKSCDDHEDKEVVPAEGVLSFIESLRCDKPLLRVKRGGQPLFGSNTAVVSIRRSRAVVSRCVDVPRD